MIQFQLIESQLSIEISLLWFYFLYFIYLSISFLRWLFFLAASSPIPMGPHPPQPLSHAWNTPRESEKIDFSISAGILAMFCVKLSEMKVNAKHNKPPEFFFSSFSLSYRFFHGLWFICRFFAAFCRSQLPYSYIFSSWIMYIFVWFWLQACVFPLFRSNQVSLWRKQDIINHQKFFLLEKKRYKTYLCF